MPPNGYKYRMNRLLTHFTVLMILLLGCIPAGVAAGASGLSGSVYLLKHKDDPIRWRMFNRATLDDAHQQKKPIFLSSGYEACYWCYRMHKDALTNKKVARLINSEFVPVLVDRELMPGTDAELQSFMQAVNGVGGWPANVILSPDGSPVFAMTYVDGEALLSRLEGFLKAWGEREEELTKAAQEVAASLSPDSVDPVAVKPDELLAGFLDQTQRLADTQEGGFTHSAKFPHAPQLLALLTLHRLTPSETLAEFLTQTLDAMARRGMRDSVNGGFFRYTEDRQWRRPHYEKMLYSQALLARLYVHAGLLFSRPDWVAVGVDTARFAVTRMRTEDGFYASSLAATDAQGKAGGDYLWTLAQLKKALGSDELATLGNHFGEEATLWLPSPMGSVSVSALAKLRAARADVEPARDDKAIAAWNGLMLSALVYAAPFDPELQTEASRLAKKLSSQTRLSRVLNTAHATSATLEDLVFVAQGLSDWASANADTNALAKASQLLEQAHAQFASAEGWAPSDTPVLFMPQRQHQLPDSDLPSASAVWLSLASNAASDQLRSNAVAMGSRADGSVPGSTFLHASYVAWRVHNKSLEENSKP